MRISFVKDNKRGPDRESFHYLSLWWSKNNEVIWVLWKLLLVNFLIWQVVRSYFVGWMLLVKYYINAIVFYRCFKATWVWPGYFRLRHFINAGSCWVEVNWVVTRSKFRFYLCLLDFCNGWLTIILLHLLKVNRVRS